MTQIEKALGIDMTISSMHPLFAWSLVHSSWIHNRYVVRAGQTAYELCSARMYGGKIALFGICHGIFAHFSEVCSFMTRGL